MNIEILPETLERRIWVQENIYKIFSLYPEYRTYHGPYLSKDGRHRIILYGSKKNKTTRQFCKLKMEVLLNKRLSSNETIAHLDDNPLNDDYSNLKVLTRSEHAKFDVIRVDSDIEENCV